MRAFDAFGLKNGGVFSTVQITPTRSRSTLDNVTYTRAVGNTIQGNYIGTKADGMSALGNESGVRITEGMHNLIGGTEPGTRNVISGNDVHGIVINTNSTGNVVQGNYIGTDADGDSAVPNVFGVAIGSANNTVGGGEPGAGNLISGNSWTGVQLTGIGATGNKIQGNWIGTNALGTDALANEFIGVLLTSGANSNVIGTDADGTHDSSEGNLISGNGNAGVSIGGATSTGNVLSGNFIGTDVTGAKRIANEREGVVIAYAGGNTIGGTTAVERNIISGNAQSGIQLEFQTDLGNTVIGNYIGTDVGGAECTGQRHAQRRRDLPSCRLKQRHRRHNGWRTKCHQRKRQFRDRRFRRFGQHHPGQLHRHGQRR